MSNLRWLSLCRLLGSFALLSRGWIVPVGGATPDRLKDDRREPILESIEGLVVRDAFLDLELREGIWRGWIVPVGGSTPDRLKDDRHKDA